jgi:Flp pilus assembly protein TadD
MYVPGTRMSATEESGPPIWPSGMNAATHERLRGKVERCEGLALIGWLLDPADSSANIEFDLLVNGQLAGRHVADLQRGDLKAKGIGSGRHGFRASLPPGLLVVGENLFRLVAMSGALEVEASFEIAAPPLPPAKPQLPPEPVAQPVVFAVEPPADPAATGAARLVADLVARLGPAARAGLAEMVAARLADRDFEAVLLLTEAVATDPVAETSLVLARGRALLNLGDAGRAEPLLREVARRKPDEHSAWFDLGTALERQQRFAEAMEVFVRCRDLAPRQGRYALQAARTAAQAANGGNGAAPERPELLPEAIALAREAIHLMPRDGRPCRELSRLLYQTGDHSGALAAMEEAERRQPGISAFPLESARILVRLDQVEDALEATRRAVALDPTNDGGQFMLRVLERWSAARRIGPWRVAALLRLPEDPPSVPDTLVLPPDEEGPA